MRAVVFSHAHLPSADMKDYERWDIIGTLYEFARVGNKSALEILMCAAKTHVWAVVMLDRLKFLNAKVSEAMKIFDASAYAASAPSSPDAILALQLFAQGKNETAQKIMKTVKVEKLALMAVRSNDDRPFVALGALVRMGNDDALQALFQIAETNPLAIVHLLSMVRSTEKYGEAIRQWFLDATRDMGPYSIVIQRHLFEMSKSGDTFGQSIRERLNIRSSTPTVPGTSDVR